MKLKFSGSSLSFPDLNSKEDTNSVSTINCPFTRHHFPTPPTPEICLCEVGIWGLIIEQWTSGLTRGAAFSSTRERATPNPTDYLLVHVSEHLALLRFVLPKRLLGFQLKFPEAILKPTSSPFFSWYLGLMLGLMTPSGILCEASLMLFSISATEVGKHCLFR